VCSADLICRSAAFSSFIVDKPQTQKRRPVLLGFIALADILPLRRGFECLRPARAGRLWPTATAVGKRQLLTLQPASAGDRNLTSNPQFFLSPLPGLHPLSASFSHGLRHGPHSVAATRLVASSAVLALQRSAFLVRPVLKSRRPQKRRSALALLTLGFWGFRCKEPTVNSHDELTVATSWPSLERERCTLSQGVPGRMATVKASTASCEMNA